MNITVFHDINSIAKKKIITNKYTIFSTCFGDTIAVNLKDSKLEERTEVNKNVDPAKFWKIAEVDLPLNSDGNENESLQYLRYTFEKNH